MSKSSTVAEPVAELQFLTVLEVAKTLHLSRAKTYQLVDSGEIRSAKFGGARRIPVSALREYVDRSMTLPSNG